MCLCCVQLLLPTLFQTNFIQFLFHLLCTSFDSHISFLQLIPLPHQILNAHSYKSLPKVYCRPHRLDFSCSLFLAQFPMYHPSIMLIILCHILKKRKLKHLTCTDLFLSYDLKWISSHCPRSFNTQQIIFKLP